MKKIVKYSKSYRNISKIQKKYFEDNLINLNLVKKLNEKYIKQKKRLVCQNCKYKISNYTFLSFKVKYSICKKCGHLNGYHQNTQNFINWHYSAEQGLKHFNYYSKNFNSRVKNIVLINEKKVEEDLRNLKGMDNKMLALLAKNDIINLDDFAGLSTFDLLDKKEGIFKNLELDESKVNNMIMKAREKWFNDDE